MRSASRPQRPRGGDRRRAAAPCTRSTSTSTTRPTSRTSSSTSPTAGRRSSTPRQQAIRWAERTRGPAIELLRRTSPRPTAPTRRSSSATSTSPRAATGPSRAVEAGNQPIVVDWPTTRALEDEGFVDAFREANPDPVAEARLHLDPFEQAHRLLGPPRPDRLRPRPRRRPRGRERLRSSARSGPRPTSSCGRGRPTTGRSRRRSCSNGRRSGV